MSKLKQEEETASRLFAIHSCKEALDNQSAWELRECTVLCYALLGKIKIIES